MTQKAQIYKCDVCENIIEVVHTGADALVCCGQPMKLLQEKTAEEGNEKHLPVIDKTDGKIIVKVGNIPHPMEEKHYIEWIEVITDDGTYRKFLNPGTSPEVEFSLNGNIKEVRSYCNIHGLWSKKL